MHTELAETGKLQELLGRLGAGLDTFQEFTHLDAQHPSKDWQSQLTTALPQQGEGIDSVLDTLIQQVVANGSPVPKPGFTSYITTGATTIATLATTAASVASPQRYMLTAFNLLEELSLQWMAEMFSLGAMQGVYSSGGSVANLVAMGAARQSAFERIGIDPAANGVTRPVSIYASTECHHTIQRAAGVLGLGRRAVKAIACDDQGRMRASELVRAIEADLANDILPMAIVANAGTTNTGAIDPLAKIGAIAKQYGIWFHVDGAYGLPGILDERISHLFAGLELADSVIVDPHKWLGASVGVAATYVHDRELLRRAFTQEPADYLEGTALQEGEPSARVEHSLDDFGIPYFDYGVELSAPCRGVVVWAMIREIGVTGLRQRMRRHNDMAAFIVTFAEDCPQLEILLAPTLSICCFRYVSEGVEDLDRLNQRLHRQLVRENQYMPSTTRVKGQLALRPCFVGARHEQDQVEGLMAAVLRIGATLL
ncbi:MAG: aminotransferase class V-fold PLP-dependent enzyme [Reinekea forsetii]|nr:aminotransferase class V-fold PLP-dependent enzyme [Reinekea forsetii]